MASLKFEYPYIKFLTIEEKKEYQSDLPENLDNLEVFHIKTSDLYNEEPCDYFRSRSYWTPKDVEERSTTVSNVSLWGSLFFLVLAQSLKKHRDMYSTNIVANYRVYSTENWGQYLRLRSHLILSTAMIAAHFWWFKGSFSNYPKILDR